MANLNYNKDIFTKVYKFDNTGSYTGVKVSGKLNQYNGQDYYLLDAIDIDWNGAYVKNLNTYIYSTEDLINCLNFSYSNFNNYVPSSYYSSYSKTIIENFNEQYSYIITEFDQKLTYVLELLYGINFTIDNIENIALDRSNFYTVNYDDIVNPDGTIKFKNRIYYILDDATDMYQIVSYRYVLNHPNRKYYFNIISNILEDMSELDQINEFIGTSELDIMSGTYTYTGLIKRLYEYDIDIEGIHDQLNNTTEVASNAYELAFNAYTYTDNIGHQVDKNTYAIGYHSSYNVYKPIQELSNTELNKYLETNNNNIYIYDNENNSYRSVTYNSNYIGDYYVHYNYVSGSGIELEIENLESKIYDNSYLLYKLHTVSDDPNYINIYITPENKTKQERTIHTNIYKSNISTDTGITTTGLITDEGLKDSFSYVFNWEILNK